MSPIDQIIKNRRTVKVLTDKPLEWHENSNYSNTIEELLNLAATAPYHFKCNKQYIESKELNSCLPYRFYILNTQKCRDTSRFIETQDIEAGKITNMLYAADAVLIVSWLPEPSSINKDGQYKDIAFEGNLKNMEHISATSAAIQNVLIGATARAIPNYWSSGGKLRSAPLRTYLNIPEDEIIAGTIFLFPQDIKQEVMRIYGKLRDEGKEQSSWVQWLQ